MRPLRRFLALLLWLAALLAAPAAHAEVRVHFQSFNGSPFFGRFPHTFVIFEGQLGTGEAVSENFGFSAKAISPAVLTGPVKHMIYVEKRKWYSKTNRHFTITVDDATYQLMKAEVAAWRDAPGAYYDLDKRNCIHFVGRIAEMAGLTVDYPPELLRKPRAWLNHIVTLNPEAGGKQFN